MSAFADDRNDTGDGDLIRLVLKELAIRTPHLEETFAGLSREEKLLLRWKAVALEEGFPC